MSFVPLDCTPDPSDPALQRFDAEWLRRSKRPLPRHGKPGTYNNHRCRCRACRNAMTMYQRSRRARHALADLPQLQETIAQRVRDNRRRELATDFCRYHLRFDFVPRQQP
jgi:hypothetical protein